MKVLILTLAFPPSPHANGKRPYYVARAMLDAGWQVEVLTTHVGLPAGAAELIEHPRFCIRRVSDPVLDAEARLASHPKLARAVHLLANGLIWPDNHRLWVRRILSEVIRQGASVDRVIAFVFPRSMLLAGNQKSLVDHRWVFDMQEAVSPQFAIHPRRSPFQRWLTPRLCKLERRTLHRAGHVVFTSETSRRAYLDADLAVESRATHIPFFYDPSAFGNPATAAEGFEIGYFGNFDLHDHRSPAVFLKALARFLELHPEARPATRFLFHGAWLPEHDPLLERLALTDVASIHRPIPFQEYLGKISTCTILLLVAAAEHNLFMPSKVVDYIATGRPVLAFAPANSEVASVLRQAGHSSTLCDVSDSEAGAAALSRCWMLHRANQLGSIPVSDRQPWSSDVQIPRYLEIVANS